MAKTISPKALHDLIAENNSEFAVVDVRGERAFSDGHLMHAISVPIGRLEVMIGNLVPRLGTPVYLTDGSEGLSKKPLKGWQRLGIPTFRFLKVAHPVGLQQVMKSTAGLTYHPKPSVSLLNITLEHRPFLPKS